MEEGMCCAGGCPKNVFPSRIKCKVLNSRRVEIGGIRLTVWSLISYHKISSDFVNYTYIDAPIRCCWALQKKGKN
jgi:hypothetical protein